MASTPADRILARNGPILLSALLSDTRLHSATIADHSRALYAAATRAAPAGVDAAAVVMQLRYMIRGLPSWFHRPDDAAAMVVAITNHFGIDSGAARASLSIRSVAAIHTCMVNHGTEEQYDTLQAQLRVPDDAWILFVCAVLAHCRACVTPCGHHDDDAREHGRYDAEYEHIFTNMYATPVATAVARWLVVAPPIPLGPDAEDDLWWYDPMPVPPPGSLAHLPPWAKRCATDPAFAAGMVGARRRFLAAVITGTVAAAPALPHLPVEIVDAIVAYAML